MLRSKVGLGSAGLGSGGGLDQPEAGADRARRLLRGVLPGPQRERELGRLRGLAALPR